MAGILPPMRALRPLLSACTLLGATLLGAACTGVNRTAHDLRALHAPEGAIRYEARIASRIEFAFGRMGRVPKSGLRRWVLEAAYPGADEADPDLVFLPEADPKVSRVARPHSKARDRLVALSRMAWIDPFVAGTKVELAAFLATRSRAKVARELAVRILGEGGRRAGAELVEQAVADPLDGEGVRAALERLADGVGAWEAGEGLESLTVAAGALEALPLELDDWRRVLRVTTVLERSLPERAWADGGLGRLHRRAQARCAGLALGRALRDPSDVVAGAAAEETLRIDRSLHYELFRDSLEIEAWPIAAACARSIVDRGLPEGGPPLDTWLERLGAACRLREDVTSLYDDQLRLLSCRALGRVAGADFESLRSEEWLQWYWRYSGRLVDDDFSSELGGGDR